MSTTTKGTYCARAQVARADRMVVSVEMRPPKKGELGWTVSLEADAKEALLQVVDGRGTWDEGECGYGVIAVDDWPEISRDEWTVYEMDPATGRSNGIVRASGVDESRSVTVVVSWESTETGEVVLL